jgi:hypothetical protein
MLRFAQPMLAGHLALRAWRYTAMTGAGPEKK